MRLGTLAALLIALTTPAGAETWRPVGCGDEPVPPRLTLSDRGAYNDAVKSVKAYQQKARDYSTCVLTSAHDEQTRISRQAQNRIADIQTQAIGVQQAIYARLAAQAAAFKAAAARLSRQ